MYGQVTYLAICYCILFTGFNVALSYVTTVFKGSFGYTSLSIQYLVYAFASLLAPSFTRFFTKLLGDGKGEKIMMFIASIPYIVYVAALVIGDRDFFMVASVLVGMAGGSIWLNQGVYITRLVNETVKMVSLRCATGGATGGVDGKSIIGVAMGIFFAIYNINALIGNSVALLVLAFGASFELLLWIMVGVCGLGSFMLLFVWSIPITGLPTPPPSAPAAKAAQDNDIKRGSYWGNLKLYITNPKTWLLTPYLFCQGLNIAYDFANFPTFINETSKFESSTVQTQNIAIAFLLYGFGSIIGSYMWGKVYDLFGARLFPLVLSHLILALCNTGLLLYSTFLLPYPSSFYVLSAVCFTYGLIDYCTNAIINNSNGKFYTDTQISFAFSWYRFCFCIAFSIGTFVSSFLPGVDQYHGGGGDLGFLIIVGVNVGLTVVSAVCGFVLDYLGRQERTRVETVDIGVKTAFMS